MSRSRLRRLVVAPMCLAFGVIGVVAAAPADAVTATKVQLKNGQLNVEGVGAPGGTRVMVESTTSLATVRTDQKGQYKIQATGFTAPDCYLTIRDNVGPVLTVAIPQCTRSVTPVPAVPARPSGSCVITAQPPVTLAVGSQLGWSFSATGCSPTGPLAYRVVAGAIPTGMSVGTYQGSTVHTGNLLGVPSVRGSYAFTIEATDAAGATDQENFVINVT